MNSSNSEMSSLLLPNQRKDEKQKELDREHTQLLQNIEREKMRRKAALIVVMIAVTIVILFFVNNDKNMSIEARIFLTLFVLATLFTICLVPLFQSLINWYGVYKINGNK